MSTVKLADIKPKQSVIIPLAHVIGTNTYIGKVLLPMQLQWENPLLSSMDKLKIEKMVPADQWMMMGLNKAVAQ
jgi:hypothetical protein